MSALFKYENKFMYFILSRDESVNGAWLYCSGVSMPGFLPITRGRHGLASNPAMRGLQIADLHLRNELHNRGGHAASVKGNPCAPYAPKEGDWYRQLLLISDIDEQTVKEIVGRGPLELVRSIFQACMVPDEIPAEIAGNADEFEALLSGICEKYSGQKGWPVTASAKGFRK